MSYLNNITELIQHKRVLQHVLFWFAILLMTIPKILIEQQQISLLGFSVSVCLFISQVLASYFIAYFVIAKFLSKKKYIISFILFVISTYFFLVLSRVLVVRVAEPFLRKPPFNQETILQIMSDMKYLFMYYLPSIYSTVLIFLFVKYFFNFKTAKEKELIYKSEKAAIELKTLKTQLNPHFLFNTLNNIYTLSLDNSPKTPKSIEKLSKILDHVLYRCNTKFVPLSSEIELIENYIELEKLRYDDRLKINFRTKIDQEGVIAPLILLSLVENAFKHGAGEDGGSPMIDINLNNTSTIFNFMISNTVVTQQDRTERIPIGLENIKKQLNLIYPDKFELKIDDSQKLFTVTVVIKK